MVFPIRERYETYRHVGTYTISNFLGVKKKVRFTKVAFQRKRRNRKHTQTCSNILKKIKKNKNKKSVQRCLMCTKISCILNFNIYDTYKTSTVIEKIM